MAVKPKLCMIPSGYKGGASSGDLYSVLPSDGVGDFDFSRSGSATRINKDGLIETVASNVPRLNYPLIDGVVSGCPSLLLEPSRSNLITYSEDFTATNWDDVAYPVTITSNSIISPDGSLNGTLITPSSGNSRHAIRNLSASAVSGTTYMLSVFVKKGGSRYIVFGDAGDSLWRVVTFDLDNGVVTNEYNSDGTITSYGNGWYRITCKITRANAGTVQFSLGASETNSNSGLSSFDNTSLTVYAYGCQIESNSSYATSYIPTSGSQTTRSAETCNNAGNANTFNDSEGVLMAEISALANDSSLRHITLGDGSSSNAVSIRYDNPNIITLYVNSGGTSQASFTASVQTLSFNKCLIKYKENDFSAWVNGFQVGVTDTVGIVFPSGTLDRINFDIGYGTLPFYGSTKQIQYFDTALTDTDLEELTSWTSFNEMATSQQYTIQ